MTATGTKQCACGRPISANKEACRDCLEAPHGELSILNVGDGDTKITFDKRNVGETIRAKRIITDMLRRGYALVVEVERKGEKAYERVQAFDEKTGEYIIADLDPVKAEETINDPKLKPSAAESGLCDCGRQAHHRGACKGKRHGTSRLPMATTKATGIGRSAGG
jgi:hypothetical protein